jgi:heme exporter protein A
MSGLRRVPAFDFRKYSQPSRIFAPIMPNRAEAPPHLAVLDLECSRGDRLLFSELNFDLTTGQLLQIEGANGSGKTSLLRILCGLSRPSAGAVHWRGRDVLDQRALYFSEMAYLGHALGIKPELSAVENLRVSLALAGVPFRSDDLFRALEMTGLGGCEDMPARSLSAGQKQRIALARILACPALLWILDEPFTALDVTGIALLRGLLEKHLEQGGMAVLTSHQVVAVRGDVVKLALT